MNAILHLVGQHLINPALTLDAAYTLEHRSNQMDAKMSLAARSRAGMAGMAMRLILDRELLGREGRFELAANDLDHAHGR